MGRETFAHMCASARKWSSSLQEYEELLTLCCEAYFINMKGKEICNEDNYGSVVFRNACIDFLRQKSRRKKREILFTDMNEEWEELRKTALESHNFDEIDTCLMISDFYDNLSDIDKLFVDNLTDEVPYTELADKLNKPLNTIKVKIHRCRKRWCEIPQIQGFAG